MSSERSEIICASKVGMCARQFQLHNIFEIMDSEEILRNFFDRSKIEDFSVTDNIKKDNVADVSEDILSEILEAVRLQHSRQLAQVMNNIENGFEIEKSFLPEIKELKFYINESYSLSYLVQILKTMERECEEHNAILSERILLQIETLKLRTQELDNALEEIVLSKRAISSGPNFAKCASLLESD